MTLTTTNLQAAMPHVLAAPKDGAAVEMLCLRPASGVRKYVDRITMTKAGGIPGERWATEPWLKLADGSGDPRIQVSILCRRVLDLVWQDRDATPHPGDTFIVDMDLSEANLPAGTLLRAGTAVLRVSNKFNHACIKWKDRYGADALRWVVTPANRKYRLRGILCEVVQDGVVTSNDHLQKIPA